SFIMPILKTTNVPLEDITDKSTGEKIIRTILYTGIFHQGKEEDIQLRKEIETELKSPELVKYCFYLLVFNISILYINSANLISNILMIANALHIPIPIFKISDKEKQFINFVINKSYEFADLLKSKNGDSSISITEYQKKALNIIESTFGVVFQQET
nr:hypothetical protein [Lentisphaeria bacterium]